jgi:hypothetical protein
MTNDTSHGHRTPDLDTTPTSKSPDQDTDGSAKEPQVRFQVSDAQADEPMSVDGGASKYAADPFDIDSLRLTQDFASAVGVRRLITTVPVRKPSREWFIRTHPDPAYRLPTGVLELKEDREIYLVARDLWPELGSEPTFSTRLLVSVVNGLGVLFLWPIRLPGPDGKIDDWSRSELEAADQAKSLWVRVTANMSLKAYEVFVAPNQSTNPIWPDLPFQEIIRIAFRDKMISDRMHPVLRRLRGES